MFEGKCGESGNIASRNADGRIVGGRKTTRTASRTLLTALSVVGRRPVQLAWTLMVVLSVVKGRPGLPTGTLLAALSVRSRRTTNVARKKADDCIVGGRRMTGTASKSAGGGTKAHKTGG